MTVAIPGNRYRHQKGSMYEVLHLAEHSETKEVLVVYKQLQTGRVWARPREMFEEEGRFEQVNVLVREPVAGNDDLQEIKGEACPYCGPPLQVNEGAFCIKCGSDDWKRKKQTKT